MRTTASTAFRGPVWTLLILMACAAPGMAVPILPVDTTTAGFVGMAAQGPLDQPVAIASYGEFTTVFGAATAGLANPYLAPSVAAYFANGGVNLVVVRVASASDADLIGTDGGASGMRTGLQALLDVDNVSIVAIPGAGSPSVQANMIAHCENAGDRIAILDPAVPGDFAAIQTQRTLLATTGGFAALYFPWVQAAPTGTSLLLPPSGFVAGAYAATPAPDSPVGVIATATGLAYDVDTAEQEILNPQNINAIRNLSGIRIFGARTLAGDPEWKYVAVRRAGIAIDEAITEGTAWCLAAANDATLWATLVQDTEAYLDDLFRTGWFQGVSPSDAYFVRCGLGTTMTATDILAGRTIVVVGFAPLQPAEFVVLTIVHQRSGASPVPAAGPRSLSLSAPVPNPFNPRTEIRFALALDRTVSLDIVDLRGRPVRTLMDARPLAAGEHRRQWDGNDDVGRALPSGVYFARLQDGHELATRRLVLVR